jgi:hypothetical protein
MRGSVRTTALTAAVLVVVAMGAAAAGLAQVGGAGPVNTSPPAVAGSAQQGQTLVATSGTWSASGPSTYAYQWRRCEASCSSIAGATDDNYTLVADDVGTRIQVRVTATSGGESASADSAATATVTGITPPSSTSPPTITGSAVEGQSLAAANGGWAGTEPIEYAYLWRRCNSAGGSCSSIPGASGASYVLSRADVGRTIRVRVTASNAAGSAQATSNATGVVAAPAAAPAATARPGISGNVAQGQTLSATTGRWSGTQPITVAFQWWRCDSRGGGCGAIGGANGSKYTVSEADGGHTLRIQVTATNAAGSAQATSNATRLVAVAVVAPVNTGRPVISGPSVEGQTLVTTRGTWTGTQPIRFSYRWQRCESNGGGCVDIAAATASHHLLTSSDIGHLVRAHVTATNRAGSQSADSGFSAVIQPKAPPQPSGAIRTSDGRTSIPASSVNPPERLLVEGISFAPSVIGSRDPVVARFRVSDTRGYVVRDALVYLIGLPYGWLRRAPETRTDGEGWATIQLQPTANLPLRRGALVMFLRVRKEGDKLLTGVSSRRLIQIRISP